MSFQNPSTTVYKNEQKFLAAKKNFVDQDYKSTIRLLNDFLNENRFIHSEQYLQALYLLGRSYNQIGNYSKSLRAYNRYIRSWTTNPVNNNHLRYILTHTLKISQKLPKKQVRELLSNLFSLKVPEEARNLLHINMANLSSDMNFTKYASLLYQKGIDDKEKRENIYGICLSATLLYRINKIQSAKRNLKECLDRSEGNDHLKNFAIINTARLESILGNYRTATSIYRKVERNSSFYPSSVLELVYLYKKTNNFELAVAKAKEFLALKDVDINSKSKIEHLLGFLTMKANYFDAASEILTKREKIYMDFLSWINQRYSDSQTLSRDDIKNIVKKGDLIAIRPKEVKKIIELKSRMKINQDKLQETKSEQKDILYYYGKNSLQDLTPHLTQNINQIGKLGNRLISIGNDILSVEKDLYSKKINDYDKILLQKSSLRRKLINLKATSLAARHKNLRLYVDHLDLDKKIESLEQKGHRLLAMMTAIKLNHSSNEVDIINNLIKSLNHIITNLSLLESDLQTSSLREIYTRTDQQVIKKIFLDNSLMIVDDFQLLSPYRETLGNSAENQLRGELINSWTLWESQAHLLTDTLTQLEKKVNRFWQQRMNDTVSINKKNEALSKKLAKAHRDLEHMTKSFSMDIFEYYKVQAKQKLAQIRQWKVDNSWNKNVKERDRIEVSIRQQELDILKTKEEISDIQYEAVQ